MTTGTIGDGMPYLVRLDCQEITGAVALFPDNAVRPTHAVNPLDLQGEIISYEPLPIPPHLIFRVAEIPKNWFIFSGQHLVHLPRRLTVAGQIPTSGLKTMSEIPTRQRNQPR